MQVLFNIFIIFFAMPFFCSAHEFPDVGGVLDFSKPQEIANRVFILTNPKSGSHLLLYSIMKITQRPLRLRLPYWYFENDPPYFHPDNIMNYPLDFTKQTIYWGHEYTSLPSLNHSGNKLIFILRNYKETIISNLFLKLKEHKINAKEINQKELSDLFLAEIINNGNIFQEYMNRIQTFDDWNPEERCLVLFNDLVKNPHAFVPKVMDFIGDHSNYMDFIQAYDEFKLELMSKYNLKENRTGSGSDLNYFSTLISKKSLKIADNYLKRRYPILWERYLEQFREALLLNSRSAR